MRHVGDVHLQQPAAVVAAFDVDGIVEIAGGLAVNGDDGKPAKILAAAELGVRNGTSELFGFFRDFGGESMRQVVLANNDFGVYAEFAGAAEDFDDAAGGSRAISAVAKEFGVDDGAVKFRDVRKATAFAAAFFSVGEKLFAKSGRKLFAGGKLDVVLDARIVGHDDAAA